MYSDIIWKHFAEPKNVGSIEKANATGIAGTPNSGPFFILTFQIVNGVFRECGFETYGCAPAIAAGSVLTEILKGTSVQEAREVTVERLVAELGGVPDEKMHCPRLAIEALRKAVGWSQATITDGSPSVHTSPEDSIPRACTTERNDDS